MVIHRFLLMLAFDIGVDLHTSSSLYEKFDEDKQGGGKVDRIEKEKTG